MQRYLRIACVFLVFSVPCLAPGADWRQFRGPTGQGISEEKGLPVKWSAADNLAWKIKLPGAGGWRNSTSLRSRLPGCTARWV